MYMFTKLHDRRIPNVGVRVGVGVGPVEFQLYEGKTADCCQTVRHELARPSQEALLSDGELRLSLLRVTRNTCSHIDLQSHAASSIAYFSSNVRL